MKTLHAQRTLWRQPLLHFLVAGALIFALNAIRGTSEPAGSDRIVVTVAQVERIAGLWQKTWGRPPSESELQALIRDHVREEVYYREALKLGLDVNDTVIRRRLRQKMEFFATDDAAGVSDEAVLERYFQQSAERYRTSPRYDFEQVYLATPDEQRVRQTLDALRAGVNPASLGDPISLPRTMAHADDAAVVRTFGSGFNDALNSLEIGAWSPPVVSGFGQHLVRITHKEPATVPALDEVRARVENDWQAEQYRLARDAAFEEMLARYDVEIEVPMP